METTVGGWTTTFFVEALAVDLDAAPVYLAAFWLGLMAGRFAIGVLMQRASGAAILVAGVATALVSALWLVSARGVAAAALAVLMLGAGLAPAFPVLLGLTGDRYAHLSGTALSMAFGMALTGGMLMPYATGVLAGAYGLRPSFAIVPGSLRTDIYDRIGVRTVINGRGATTAVGGSSPKPPFAGPESAERTTRSPPSTGSTRAGTTSTPGR